MEFTIPVFIEQLRNATQFLNEHTDTVSAGIYGFFLRTLADTLEELTDNITQSVMNFMR